MKSPLTGDRAWRMRSRKSWNADMENSEQRVEDAKGPAVKTIDRAERVLRGLAAGGADGLALRVIAAQCDVGKATAHRLLSALIDAGFAFQDAETRHYRLGAGLAML